MGIRLEIRLVSGIGNKYDIFVNDSAYLLSESSQAVHVHEVVPEKGWLSWVGTERVPQLHIRYSSARVFQRYIEGIDF